jgi:hypothetical protein
MYHTIVIDHRRRSTKDERRRDARIAHLKALAERCPRKGVLRRCAPAVAAPCMVR